MPSPLAHRCWTIAYFACWVLAAAAGGGLVAALGWGAYGTGAVIDDDVALLGIPLGGAAGFFIARATRQRRFVHRALVVVGPLLAAAGVVGAVTMFAAARAVRGEGWFAGLGEALVGLVALVAAAIGVLWLGAGAAGLLAARAASGERPAVPVAQ